MKTHEITKVRRNPVRRELRVKSKQHITPRMLRIVFHSEQLADFESPSPDDHIKVFIPINTSETVKRDFTPRAWDVTAGTFTLDFALHEHGPAIEWARNAGEGDVLQIGGPRGSTVVPDDFDWYLLIGDATALPSFGRRLESLRSEVPVHAFVMVADAAEQQSFATRATSNIRWLSVGASPTEDAAMLRDTLTGFDLPPGDGFIWVAAEASVSREMYRLFVTERAHPTNWIKASAYWTESEKTS